MALTGRTRQTLTNEWTRVPTWDEGVDRLVAKLSSLVSDGALTLNDVRVILFLAQHWQRTKNA